MSGIHLVIFCKSSYKNVLPYSCYGAETFIEDNIISKTIVTENYFEYKNYNILTDDEILNFIDKNRQYKNLYDLNIYKPGWIKQQILKLSLDAFFNGDILVLDADLLFLRPMQFIENKKYNLYINTLHPNFYFLNGKFSGDSRYILMMRKLLGFEQQTSQSQSFVTDFSIFNSHILNQMKNEIENKHKRNWIESIDKFSNLSRIYKNFSSQNSEIINVPVLSEYELYGNYLLKNYKDSVNKIIEPDDIPMRTDMLIDYESYSPENLVKKIKKHTNIYYQSITE
jgi:hypothetical protein